MSKSSSLTDGLRMSSVWRLGVEGGYRPCLRMADDLVPDDLRERAAPFIPRPPRRHRFPGLKPVDDRFALMGIVCVLRTGVTGQMYAPSGPGTAPARCFTDRRPQARRHPTHAAAGRDTPHSRSPWSSVSPAQAAVHRPWPRLRQMPAPDPQARRLLLLRSSGAVRAAWCRRLLRWRTRAGRWRGHGAAEPWVGAAEGWVSLCR